MPFGIEKIGIPNTEYYLLLRKTEYRIPFVIEKIRIPNTNTTIRSNYSNSIPIPNYSSHPVLNITGFVQNMPGFVLNVTGFVLNMTGFVLNMTGFVLKKT